jgi:dienelactone hydrolase
MKLRTHLMLLALATLAAQTSPGAAGTPPAPPERAPETEAHNIATATRFVDALGADQFEFAAGQFAPAVQAQLPAEQLRAVWQGFLDQYGAYAQQVAAVAQKVRGFDAVVVTCEFAHGALHLTVVFDGAGQIAGIFAAPAAGSASAESAPPPYVQPDRFAERAVEVHSGDWVLPGTVSMPQGAGPVPAVVLVHGSGPQDQDETIGPNKPFRDLAWGLASAGIAVLRYDKRTYADPQRAREIQHITAKEEVIDDAVAALALLRQTPGVDPRRVFLLGHSLGGMLAPRIAQADPQVAGVIILAGLTQPLEDTILDQYTYIASLGGPNGHAAQQQLDQIQQQVARAKDPALTPDTPASELPLGISASYLLDLRANMPTAIAKTLPQPMLILRGGTDYQVTAKDTQGWQDALRGRDDVTFKTYPGLYHLFMPSQAPDHSTPADYTIPGHVAPEVVDDIATWIKGH